MNISQMLEQTGAVDAISRELGVDLATAQAGATALLPSILSGFQNPVAAPEAQTSESAFPGLRGLGGLGGLLGSIGRLGGGELLDNVTSSEPTQVHKGDEILGQIFGSKDGSRAVAASASAQSGVATFAPEEDAADPRDGRCGLRDEAAMVKADSEEHLAASSAASHPRVHQTKQMPLLPRRAAYWGT